MAKAKKKTTETRILDYLNKRATPANIESIVKQTSSNINTARNVLRQLVKEGTVTKSAEGWSL